MSNPKAILVAGLAFGDEAKGATVDFLCRQLPVDLVVRYNGGSQAAHNVVTPEGIHHCFSQFGAGMLADSRVRTHLSRFMLVDPLTMMNEAEALTLARDHAGFHYSLTQGAEELWSLTTVDPRCVIITPFHKRLNRLREQARRQTRHGSCGMGVGVAREWSLKYGDAVLYAGDLLDFTKTVDKLNFLADLLDEEVGCASGSIDFSPLDIAHQYSKWPVTLRDTLPDSEFSVFEGAQGVLLDETHGEEPYRTWTDCTFNNALTLCGEAGIEDVTKIGCLRSYFTRHGAGPFPTECMQGVYPPDVHNINGEWQGSFRTGDFDFNLAEKAVNIIGGVDYLAVSHYDCAAYSNPGVLMESVLGTKVGVVGRGPTANDRKFTEAWLERGKMRVLRGEELYRDLMRDEAKERRRNS